MFNLIDFTNDKYKLLKFLYDNQIEIKNGVKNSSLLAKFLNV